MAYGKSLQGNNDNKTDMKSPKYSSKDFLDKESQQMFRQKHQHHNQHSTSFSIQLFKMLRI